MPADPNLEEPTVVSPLSFTKMQKQIEQVGQGYESLKKKYAYLEEKMQKGASAKFSDSEHSASDRENSDEETKGDATNAQQEDYEKKRKRKTREDIEREALAKGDLYALLGLENKTYEAGDQDIRKSYQKLALKFHPDKLGDKITEQDKAMWLKIQDAYETLSDPVKRKRYDSSLPFNESIPQEGDWTDEKSFYEVFSAVFNRNSMWAKKKPVPNLGDDSTPLAEVKKFYKYWDNFDSWREFSQYDEYDLNEAQDRYERRYMDNENRKLRAKHEKKERARLIKLAEMAYKNDPRIKKELEEAELERQRKKEEKKLYKQQQAQFMEEKKREQEEKKAAEQQAKIEAENKVKEEKRQTAINYKQKVKELIELC